MRGEEIRVETASGPVAAQAAERKTDVQFPSGRTDSGFLTATGILLRFDGGGAGRCAVRRSHFTRGENGALAFRPREPVEVMIGLDPARTGPRQGSRR
jgi:hypothetical protein